MQENNIVLLIITNNVTLYLANSSRVILAHTLKMLAKNATFIHLIVVAGSWSSKCCHQIVSRGFLGIRFQLHTHIWLDETTQ